MMMGKTLNAGQICLAPDYVMVPANKAREFVSAAETAVTHDVSHAEGQSRLHLGHQPAPLRPSARATLPMRKPRARRLSEINPAKENFTQQPFYKIPPTLVLNPTDDMKIMKEEIFGPLLPVKTYDPDRRSDRLCE